MTKQELALGIFTVFSGHSKEQAELLANRGHGAYTTLLRQSKDSLQVIYNMALKAAQNQGRCTCWADSCLMHK